MARLPQPGGDAGNWGDILNDYLSQSLASDGTLKTDTVGAGQLRPGAVVAATVADGAITEAKLDTALQAKVNSGGGGGGGPVASTDITDATATGRGLITATNAAAARTTIGAGTSNLTLGTSSTTAKAGDYAPTADDVVETTTNKVLTAAERTKLAAIEASAEVNNISDTDATGLTGGGNSSLHYHAADRNRANHTGTQSAGTITGLATVATTGSYNDLSNRPTIPTVPVTSVASKTGDVTLVKADVGLGSVDNTSDASKPVSTATQTALDDKVTGPASATDSAIARYSGTTGKVVKASTVSIDDAGSLTLPDAANLTFATTTGTKIGTATTQKIGFFNATPVTQPAATNDLGTILSNLGLRAAGTAYPINTSGAVSLSGGLSATGNVRFNHDTPTASASITLSASRYYQRADATTAPIVLTLPATTNPGYTYAISKTDASANTVTIAGTINGATNYVLTDRYQSIVVASTATSGSWITLGGDPVIERSVAATLTNKTLNSPTLAGTPTTPTAAANTNTTQVASTAYVDTAKGGAMGVVVHGATAGTARPTGYACITWIGSVQPTNAVTNDIWVYKA